MTLRVCRGCTTRFAVGLPACPHCGSTDHEEASMPKITRRGGPSYHDAHAVTEEEVPSSPGTSSSPSTEKPESKPEPSETGRRSRAPKTGNRSPKPRTAASSAGSTATDRTAADNE